MEVFIKNFQDNLYTTLTTLLKVILQCNTSLKTLQTTYRTFLYRTFFMKMHIFQKKKRLIWTPLHPVYLYEHEKTNYSKTFYTRVYIHTYENVSYKPTLIFSFLLFFSSLASRVRWIETGVY